MSLWGLFGAIKTIADRVGNTDADDDSSDVIGVIAGGCPYVAGDSESDGESTSVRRLRLPNPCGYGMYDSDSECDSLPTEGSTVSSSSSCSNTVFVGESDPLAYQNRDIKSKYYNHKQLTQFIIDHWSSKSFNGNKSKIPCCLYDMIANYGQIKLKFESFDLTDLSKFHSNDKLLKFEKNCQSVSYRTELIFYKLYWATTCINHCVYDNQYFKVKLIIKNESTTLSEIVVGVINDNHKLLQTHNEQNETALPQRSDNGAIVEFDETVSIGDCPFSWGITNAGWMGHNKMWKQPESALTGVCAFFGKSDILELTVDMINKTVTLEVLHEDCKVTFINIVPPVIPVIAMKGPSTIQIMN